MLNPNMFLVIFLKTNMLNQMQYIFPLSKN